MKGEQANFIGILSLSPGALVISPPLSRSLDMAAFNERSEFIYELFAQRIVVVVVPFSPSL